MAFTLVTTWRLPVACLSSSLQYFFARRVICRSSMSGNSNGSTTGTHLERTENLERQEVIAPATVTEISHLSETVKRLCLKVEDDRFTFKPGQWVDFFIPGVETVGGFSICSSPKTLIDTSTIELAVKYSDHPPALWVHTKCNTGSKVQMRVGGNFFFDPEPGAPSPDLLLVAGGVGINPLYSILQHVGDITSDPQHNYTAKTTLLFSAKNQDELLYKNSLLQISKRHPSIVCKYFTTKPGSDNQRPAAESIQCHHGRISDTSLKEAVSSLDRSQLTCYICGPPPMIKHVTDILHRLNIGDSRIHFEKWW